MRHWASEVVQPPSVQPSLKALISRQRHRKLSLQAPAGLAGQTASHLSRVLAVAAAKYDSDWLEDYNLQHVLYQHRDPQEPFWYPNAANEAGAYLQFILDHYHCLPKAPPILAPLRAASGAAVASCS